MQTKISAQLVAHSKNKQGDELASLMITFPRYILAELNTHRMLSKNSASSRAIPVARLLKSVKENPFVPVAWQKEHPGMQGFHYWENELCGDAFKDIDRAFQYEELKFQKVTDYLTNKWLVNAKNAVSDVESWQPLKTTKQMINRQLEPFMWHTVLITGNVNAEAWENFWELRCPQYSISGIPTCEQNDAEGLRKVGEIEIIFKSRKQALNELKELAVNTPHIYEEPYKNMLAMTDMDWRRCNRGLADIHMMDLAEAIWDAVNESEPKLLQPGEWHIPFGDKITDEGILNYLSLDGDGSWGEPEYNQVRVKIATAMAARTSYTVVGEEKEIKYETLVDIHDNKLINQKPLHASPMEHCAPAMTDEEYNRFLKGEVLQIEVDGKLVIISDIKNAGWCRNFKGFKQYRYILEEQFKNKK